MAQEPLLGGTNATPATEEEKKEFERLTDRLLHLTNEEWDRLQELEGKLTKSEYIFHKYGV